MDGDAAWAGMPPSPITNTVYATSLIIVHSPSLKQPLQLGSIARDFHLGKPLMHILISVLTHGDHAGPVVLDSSGDGDVIYCIPFRGYRCMLGPRFEQQGEFNASARHARFKT
jgi:hypothetical protein